jgi:hypothetical protein
MITLIAFNFSIFFAIIFGYRNYWQIRELEGRKVQPFSDFWHQWQFILQLYVGACVGCIIWYLKTNILLGLSCGLLFGAVFWFVFEGILGMKLYRKFFYVDKNTIGKYFNNNFKRAELVMSLAKIIFLASMLTLSLCIELLNINLHKWIKI